MDTDVVVGLDSSTTATKAIAWNRQGGAAAEGRASIPLSSPKADWYEQNAEDWWASAASALREMRQRLGPARIAAIAISNQRETFVPLSADGNPIRPAIIWMDRRCSAEVDWLGAQVGSRRIHEISGKPPDMGPVAYRLAWMLRHEPEAYGRTAMFADVHAYLAWRLTGQFRTSWASADPLGLLDMQKKAWCEEILAPLALSAGRLPELAAPGTVIGCVSDGLAASIGIPAGTPVVAGGGDGQAAGLGVNALGAGRAYLNLGTAVVAGIHSAEYRVGRAWRTMGSCSGDGFYLETTLRSGTFLVDWFLEQCGGQANRRELRARLEAEASALPAGSGGVLAVPYWGAVMTPYWDPDARGCFVGLTGAHQTAHLYRALLEGIALEQALVMKLIEQDAGERADELVAIGGGAASELWCQIMADACGTPLKHSQTLEASCLGAAMCAAAGCGWFDSPRSAAAAMSGGAERVTEPDPKRAAHYAELREIYRELYPQLCQSYHKLARFVAQS